MFPVDGVANGTGKGSQVERVEIFGEKRRKYYPNLDREASGTEIERHTV